MVLQIFEVDYLLDTICVKSQLVLFLLQPFVHKTLDLLHRFKDNQPRLDVQHR